MNRKEITYGDKKEDPRFPGSQHLSRLQQYNDVQALLSGQNRRNTSSDLQSLLSSSGGFNLSARSMGRLPPMMDAAVMQQRLSLQEETRLRMMSQLQAGSGAMRSPTSMAPLKSSEKELSSLDTSSESNEPRLQSHLRKRPRQEFEEERRYAGALPSLVIGGGRPGSLGGAVRKMLSLRRNDFPLPSLKTVPPRKNAPLVSLVSHQDKWDSLSGKLRRFEGRIGPVETKLLVRELFGRAVQFKTAVSTRKTTQQRSTTRQGA
jgi:hypothetical protein